MRPEKKYAVQEITQRLKDAESVVVTNYAGLTAEQLNDLRTRLYDQSAGYMVVKNRLMKIAAQEAGLEELGSFLNGPTGVVVGADNYGAVLKELVKFNKETKKSEICGGYVEEQYFNADGIKAVAELPSKEVLQARLLAGLQAPISSLVGLMGQRLASFVRVLDAIAKKRAEQE